MIYFLIVSNIITLLFIWDLYRKPGGPKFQAHQEDFNEKIKKHLVEALNLIEASEKNHTATTEAFKESVLKLSFIMEDEFKKQEEKIRSLITMIDKLGTVLKNMLEREDARK